MGINGLFLEAISSGTDHLDIMGYKNKKSEAFASDFAVRTGLEPATPCVTGMYSNQLNYRTR